MQTLSLPACAVRSLSKIDHFCGLQGSYAVLAVRPDERLDGSVLVLRCGLSFKTTFKQGIVNNYLSVIIDQTQFPEQRRE
jgi:hypothetical protein